MSGHARLSPSSAHRWMACPGSVRLSEEIHGDNDIPGGPYAEEGTRAHTLAYLRASLHFGLVSRAKYKAQHGVWLEQVPEEFHEDMGRHAESYVDLLQGLVDQHPHSQVLLEQKVDPRITAVWGTLDAAVVSPEHASFVDYKYGQGVRVDAPGNPQLMLYALGGLYLVEEVMSPETVTFIVHQPRLGHISKHSLEADQLRQWGERVAAPAALLALSDDAYLAPSEDACRFCPAAGDCKARMQYMTRRAFGSPDAMTPDEFGEVLALLPDISAWCKAVEKRALQLADSGTRIPGWKMVRSGGRRAIVDQDKAIRVLSRKGFPQAQTVRKTLKPLGELEKIVGGKAALHHVLGDLIEKSRGREALVPEDDERPAIDSDAEAVEVFSKQDPRSAINRNVDAGKDFG